MFGGRGEEVKALLLMLLQAFRKSPKNSIFQALFKKVHVA